MHRNRRGRFFLFLTVSFLTFLSTVGCQQREQRGEEPVSDENLVRSSDFNVVKEIGQGDHRFTIYTADSFQGKVERFELDATGSAAADSFLEARVADQGLLGIWWGKLRNRLRRPSPSRPGPQSLLLGYPLRLVGQKNVLGAVVTQVSDTSSEKFGRLKLTDLTPLHVKTSLVRDRKGNYGLLMSGCIKKCTDTEADKVEDLLAFPIVGVDQQKQEVILDLAAVGRNLDLIKMLDPKGEHLQLKTKSTQATVADFSDNTLVFDVQTHMVPLAGSGAEVDFTTRWYLRPSSVFDPGFVARSPAAGVGFFTTERGKEERISRFAGLESGSKKVKYYVKNVPTEYQAAFASAFDGWNQEFRHAIGRDLLEYEFVPADDPRNRLLVTGDVRYNIIEWDLVNAAPYGGLGPSVANQITGETLSANILVQGPKIVEIYTKWFEGSHQILRHREVGDDRKAEALELQLKRQLNRELAALEGPRFDLKLGGGLAFRVVSQLPSLQDPIMQRVDFDEVPEGFSYAQYMNGYFHDLVAHELGHNLGLRHNFRGNLGAENEKAAGKVSRSVMEYLNRNFRHLDLIGPYDAMAIAYGYGGRAPAHTDWFCTDEDKPDNEDLSKSAECSSEDATNDPFGYLQIRLRKAVDKIVARGSVSAPDWKVDDMERELEVAVEGLAFYAATAEATALGWTNFSKPGRPVDAGGIKEFAVSAIRDPLCDPSLRTVIDGKESVEAKQKTTANLDAFRAKVASLVRPFNIVTETVLLCQ